MRGARRLWAATVGAGILLASRAAIAGNGGHPRTPVDWSDAPCLTIIDRSRDPIYPLSYAIPLEDTELTEDEVADSRTHQFFGFCRDHELEDILPNWITEADLDAAVANALGDPDDVDLELHVLDNNPDWAGCFTRINGDDQRRPITFEAASEPVLWDTMALPAGTWVVEAYTWEPWHNLWTPHPGVFKIVDDPDPAASPPAAALTFGEQAVNVGETATLDGCVDAMAGSTMTLSWAPGNPGGVPDWQVVEADIPVGVGAFELPWTPTIDAASNAVTFRLDVTDPMGRTFTAYSPVYIEVFEDFGETDCDGGFIGDDGCGESEDASTDESETSESSGGPATTTEDETASADGPGGCTCRADGSGRDASALALLALLGLRRRTRRR